MVNIPQIEVYFYTSQFFWISISFIVLYIFISYIFLPLHEKYSGLLNKDYDYMNSKIDDLKKLIKQENELYNNNLSKLDEKLLENKTNLLSVHKREEEKLKKHYKEKTDIYLKKSDNLYKEKLRKLHDNSDQISSIMDKSIKNVLLYN